MDREVSRFYIFAVKRRGCVGPGCVGPGKAQLRSAVKVPLLSPRWGSTLLLADPTAYAVGYILAPLRGSVCVGFRELIVGAVREDTERRAHFDTTTPTRR